MAKSASRYIAELLAAYQEATQKTCTEISLDLDITLSNLYRYRTGTGNPRANTVDKIINGVEALCPAAFKKVSRW